MSFWVSTGHRFADAERFLKRAVSLKPDDEFSLYQLAD